MVAGPGGGGGRDLEKFFLVCFVWPWKRNLSHIGGTFI